MRKVKSHKLKSITSLFLIAAISIVCSGFMTSSAASYSGFTSPFADCNPLNNVSQEFGEIFNERRHTGIDFPKSAGTPILAVKGGKVIRAGWDTTGFGYMVKIDHGEGLTTLYAHMKEAPPVSVNSYVSQGQVIGYVGSTTGQYPPTKLSTGNHLHFEVRLNGTYMNPRPYLTDAVPPCSPGRMITGDFNGDGKDDIATMYNYGNNEYAIHTFLSNGSGFSHAQWWNSGTGYDPKRVTGRMVAGDFNGDGKDDIATMYDYDNNEYSIHVFLSTGSGFTGLQWWNSGTGYNANNVTGRMVAGDFDGNGRDDIVTLYDYGNNNYKIHYFDSKGDSFSGPFTWSSGTGYPMGNVNNRVVAGDFNGDGRDDIAAMFDYGNYENTIHTFLSTPSGFTAPQWWHSDTGYDANNVTGRMVAGDFNGNGVDDIATIYDYGNNNFKIHYFDSHLDSFTGPFTWSSGAQYPMAHVSGLTAAGDFNGDGRADISTMYDYGSGNFTFHTFLSSTAGFSNPLGWLNETQYPVDGIKF